MMRGLDPMLTGFWAEASWSDPPRLRSKDRCSSLIDSTSPPSDYIILAKDLDATTPRPLSSCMNHAIIGRLVISPD
jgi:hypothetical protein